MKLREKLSRLGAELITERMAASGLSDLHPENVKLKEKVSRLEAELIAERDFSQQAQLRTRQDMCLDLLQEIKSHKKTKQELDIAKRKHEKAELKWLDTLTGTEAELSKEKALRISAEARANNWRAEAEATGVEVEHLQILNATFESDLDDLRAIDNENATRRADEHRGLPPAYGNLDDEDRFPPYSRHEDAGTIEVAHIKRCIRRQWDTAEDRALRCATPTAASKVFNDLSYALSKVCYSLANLTEAAPNIPSSTRQGLQKHLDQIPSAPLRALAVNDLTQNPGSTAFINDRVAKLLIELLWRTVSACNARPMTHVPSREASATTTTYHYRIDVVLTAALQCAFKKRSLPRLQFYLTQLENLRVQLKACSSGQVSYGFFGQATAWLDEQIEKERELAANSATARVADFAGEDDSDALSSRWEGSDVSERDGSDASGSQGDA